MDRVNEYANRSGMRPSHGYRAASALEGLNVLVVEDEAIISFLLEDMLSELGCAEVWHAASTDEGLALLQERKPDIATLDVNLSGRPVYPLAEALAAKSIPFIFATGYGRGGVAERWRGWPVIQKPFDVDSLAAALATAIDIGAR